MDLFHSISEFRKKIEAPVDIMGCDSFKSTTKEGKKLFVLLSLMLSSRTKDESVYYAMHKFESYILGIKFEKKIIKNHIFTDEFTIKRLNSIPIKDLENIIYGVGFHKQKAKFLKAFFSEYLNKKLPENLDETLSIKGVGKKMAFLYMIHGCGKYHGISVDSHVHRISNIIGLIRSKNENASSILLSKLFENRPEKYTVNKILVGFGQKICIKNKPKCFLCPIEKKCPKFFEF